MADNLTLDVAAMDTLHDEFITLLEEVKNAKGALFTERFAALVAHTEAHFAAEEELMRAHGFHAAQEHIDEHENLLGEMRYFLEKARKIPAFGRSYIDDYAYEKFRRHVINIDSQLAAFLKSQTEAAHA